MRASFFFFEVAFLMALLICFSSSESEAKSPLKYSRTAAQAQSSLSAIQINFKRLLMDLLPSSRIPLALVASPELMLFIAALIFFLSTSFPW